MGVVTPKTIKKNQMCCTCSTQFFIFKKYVRCKVGKLDGRDRLGYGGIGGRVG
jgi:hypothetical protein